MLTNPLSYSLHGWGQRMQFSHLKRREFITLLGGAAVAWPLTARAQQPAMPVIGFLGPSSPDTFADRQRAFHQGLKDTGYVEGENVTISYRWAENQIDRLPALADELVRRKVAVIATFASGASAAKAVTTTIPIVFVVGEDPVRLGLVASLARPGGNLTGVNFLTTELTAKRLELLRELVPAVARVAVLVNPVSYAANAETSVRDVEAAARTIGLQVQVFHASTSGEIDAAFTTLARERSDAVLVGNDPFFLSRRMQLAHLAIRHAIPATFGLREYADVGGLMSYGTNLTEAWRQAGSYAGRILKGAKPADLPVVQSSKFELVINAQTARILGIDVAPTLLATADEVIE
jgi:putative ABC transport system substrate-binding protein